MRTYLDCFPCFLQQALRAARQATDDPVTIKQVLDEVGRMLGSIPMQSPPPQTGAWIYQKVSRITGNPDPYRELKQTSIARALALYPELKQRVADSPDPLLTAIRVAIAGNVIDFGVNRVFDLEADVADVLEKDFAVCDDLEFRAALDRAEDVLYLGDNAGETVFDRVLIETIGKKVTYVVRGAPIINDATYEDAVQSGLDRVASIVSSGLTAPGTLLEQCSDDFRDRFQQAGFIISKGQGNYEGLSGQNEPVFFLLKAKCPVISRDIGVDQDAILLKRL
jgi:uncharacterized protein with ATP-grasp and redox domains